MKQVSVRDILREVFGSEAEVCGEMPLYGSDLNQIRKLRLSTGDAVFMKCNSRKRVDSFRAEAEGLEAIRKTGCIPTPAVLGYGIDSETQESFLLLEFLESGRGRTDSWERFGRQLAAMHRADTRSYLNAGADSGTAGCGIGHHGSVCESGISGTAADAGTRRMFGFSSDNYIGLSPQENAPAGSWTDFFRERRIEPQVRRAERYFSGAQLRQFASLLDHLDHFLTEPAYPSLLHGDLWAGNAMPCADGTIRLIDPAVYVGDREADLAMTELFGGFPEAFYGAYRETAPPEPGYEDRKELYNLYHLLNHLNLFGGGYLSEVLAVLRRYTG